jgi:hypothetical protein
MTTRSRIAMAIAVALVLSGCGGGGFLGLGGPRAAEAPVEQAVRTRGGSAVAVNRYLWAASLEVLDFLPVQSVDPFTGVIVTGYGAPPGGGREYRATVFIADPALDARSLKLALATRAGPVAPETVRAVEDAILTRTRQLRVADARL